MITRDTPMMSREEQLQYGRMSPAELIKMGKLPWGYFPDGNGGAYQDPEWIEDWYFEQGRKRRQAEVELQQVDGRMNGPE